MTERDLLLAQAIMRERERAAQEYRLARQAQQCARASQPGLFQRLLAWLRGERPAVVAPRPTAPKHIEKIGALYSFSPNGHAQCRAEGKQDMWVNLN